MPHRPGVATSQGRAGGRRRPGCRGEIKLSEDAYPAGEAAGLAVWCTDQAGPHQAVPYPGPSWRPEGDPACQPHEYLRDGTAKALTLFRPADGRVRLEGVTSCPDAVLHPWLKHELAAMPAPPAEPPPPRMLLVLDNLAGHETPELVCWLFERGIMPPCTPVGGSWLNMAEGLQRILKRRALDGQYPTDTAQIIARFEATARHRDAAPTPFVWGGMRAARRRRRRERQHRLGGSGAYSPVPVPRGADLWPQASQVTH